MPRRSISRPKARTSLLLRKGTVTARFRYRFPPCSMSARYSSRFREAAREKGSASSFRQWFPRFLGRAMRIPGSPSFPTREASPLPRPIPSTLRKAKAMPFAAFLGYRPQAPRARSARDFLFIASSPPQSLVPRALPARPLLRTRFASHPRAQSRPIERK